MAPNPLRPDWPTGGGEFKRRGGWRLDQLFQAGKSAQWREVRRKLRGIKYYVSLFGVRYDDQPRYQFSDAALSRLIKKHKQWNVAIGLESGWLPCKARKSFSIERPAFERIKKLGGQVDYVAVDEHLAKASSAGFGSKECPLGSTQELANDVATYLSLVRRVFPQARFATIETVPLPGMAYGVAELKDWILKLKAASQEKGVTLSYVELDNAAVPSQLPSSFQMTDLVKFERWVTDQGLGFSIIYMSEEGLTESDGGGGARFPGRLPQTDQEWSDTLLAAAGNYLAAGGNPDIQMIQSWDAMPRRGLPETEPFTFTGTARKVMQLARLQGVLGMR